jgi:magnesium transporter
MAATSAEELVTSSALGVMPHRLPWLLVCLAGTLLSGGAIDRFGETLAALGGLVLFVPAIMAMGGNTGIQTSAVTVRSLATGLVQVEEMAQREWRELKIGLSMGALLGILVYGVASLWTPGSAVAICAGLAMFAAVAMSAALGALVPLGFKALACRRTWRDPFVSTRPSGCRGPGPCAHVAGL